MQFVKNTWNRSFVGKVLVGGGGLLVGLCLCSTLSTVVTPRSTTTPSASTSASPSQTVAVNVTIYSEQPAQATPTITASTLPTEVPTAESLAPTSVPAPTDTPVPLQVLLTVKEGNDYVNVRSGPGTTFDQVGQLPKGQSSPVTGKNADATWWQIKFNDQPGWVFGELVTLSGDPSTVAVVEAPAVRATDVPVAEQPTPAPAVEQPTDAPVAEQPAAEPTQANCDPSYPDVCIAPPPPDLNCEDIPAKGFRVLQPDPHRLDGDKNGIGCEK